MKNVIQLLASALFLLTVSGCKFSESVILGFRPVKEKTEAQLLRYEKRKGLQTDNNYYYIDSASYYNNLAKTLNEDGFTRMEVYDKNGNLLPPYDTADCPAPLNRYLASLCTNTQEPVAGTALAEKMKLIKPFKNNAAAAIYNPADYDYTVILYWGRFMGISNKLNARNFEQALKKHEGCKIHYFKVTLDPVNILRQ
ncbi:MAG: hypothetical protein U0Y08_13225 [Bacteroidia bacterium]